MVNNLLLSNKQRSQIFDNFNTILNILATILFRIEFSTELLVKGNQYKNRVVHLNYWGILNNLEYLKLSLFCSR